MAGTTATLSDDDVGATAKTSTPSPSEKKNTALLLISHGSPSPEWNDSQMQLLQRVEQRLHKDGAEFASVKWGWLEFAEPDIKGAMDELEHQHLHQLPSHAQGSARAAPKIDHVVAVPVFISISSHSERDIPNCLNTRFMPARDDEMRRYIGRLPVTYACPMDHGRTEVLEEIVADSAQRLCAPQRSGTTAVICVSHGDGCEHFWGHLHSRVAKAIGNRVPGLKWNTWCYIQTLRKVGGWFFCGVGAQHFLFLRNHEDLCYF